MTSDPERVDGPREPLKIVAVMLAHNPEPITFKRALDAISVQRLQPTSLIIVDNGSDPPVAARADIQTVMLRLDRNLGVGAGHNAGWRLALGQNADFLWVLEHDTIPDPDCLALLFEAATHSSSRVGATRPVQKELDQLLSPGPPRITRKLTLNGPLLRADALERVGFLKEDFFVGQEDREFGLRLGSVGLQILRVPAACVEHVNKGAARQGKVAVSRHYYSNRNAIHQRYDRTSMLLKLGGLLFESARVALSLLVHRPYSHSVKRTAARMVAAWDGVIGRLGPRDYWFMRP
jgi:GT2 family glycosyltransferase